MCFSTVRILPCKMMLISGFVFPLATQLAISLSRGVKPKAINGVVPAILLAAGFLLICSIVARYRSYPSRGPVDFTAKLRAWTSGAT